MTLDREERKTRLERARGMCALRGYEDCVCDWLCEAHTRIEELEDRCEELEGELRWMQQNLDLLGSEPES